MKYIEVQGNPQILRKGGIHLKGRARTGRQAVHLLFLIDVSGSMNHENRLTNVKKSIKFILPFLTAEDEISIVTFSDDAETILSHMPVTDENKHIIEYKLERMTVQGRTNLSAGLLTSANVFRQHTEGQRKQGLVLLTDGFTNVGACDDATLNTIITNILTNNAGLSITSVAYGETHNAALMSKIGVEGGGSYNIVNNLENVASVFGEIVGGLLSVAAQMIEIILPPGAECETVYAKKRLEDGSMRIRIGDLYAEAEQTLIFKSSPEQGGIRVEGVAMPTLEQFSNIYIPILLEEGEESDSVLTLADYRQQVSMILTRFNAPSSSHLDAFYIEVKELKETLTKSRLKEDALVVLMLEDLNLILEERHMRRQGTEQNELTASITQHAAYLGVARGLPTPARTVGFTQVPPVYSEFSNQTQRRITQAVYTQSILPDADDPNVNP